MNPAVKSEFVQWQEGQRLGQRLELDLHHDPIAERKLFELQS